MYSTKKCPQIKLSPQNASLHFRLDIVLKALFSNIFNRPTSYSLQNTERHQVSKVYETAGNIIIYALYFHFVNQKEYKIFSSG